MLILSLQNVFNNSTIKLIFLQKTIMTARIGTDNRGLYQQLMKCIPTKQRSTRAQLRAIIDEAKYISKRVTNNNLNSTKQYFRRSKKIDVDLQAIATTASTTPEAPIRMNELPPLPFNMAEALNSVHREQWIAASKAEYDSLVQPEVWEEVQLPKDSKAL